MNVRKGFDMHFDFISFSLFKRLFWKNTIQYANTLVTDGP